MAKRKKTEQKHPKFVPVQVYVHDANGEWQDCGEDCERIRHDAMESAEAGNPRYVLTYTLTKVEFVGHRKGSVPVTDVTKEVL